MSRQRRVVSCLAALGLIGLGEFFWYSSDHKIVLASAVTLISIGTAWFVSDFFSKD